MTQLLTRDGTPFKIVECGTCDLILRYGVNDILEQFGMVRTRKYWAVQWEEEGWRYSYCPQCNMGTGVSLDTAHGPRCRRVRPCPGCERLMDEVKRLDKVIDLYDGLLLRYADADDIDRVHRARKGK